MTFRDIVRSALVPSLLLGGIVWLSPGPSAQGLGDIAKREAARRQQVNPGKKYTNENLGAADVSAPAAPAQASSPASTPAQAAPAPADSGANAGPEAPAPGSAEALALAQKQMRENKRPEAFWRERGRVVRAAMKQTNERLDGLNRRLENLESQLQNGGGSSHVQEREVTLKALASAQADAKSMQAEWDRLEARAKSENVPLEWLR